MSVVRWFIHIPDRDFACLICIDSFLLSLLFLSLEKVANIILATKNRIANHYSNGEEEEDGSSEGGRSGKDIRRTGSKHGNRI
jgi:hypothetical protein